MSSPPIPRDVQDFQFKLVSRFKVFNKSENLAHGPVNALAVSSKHGLIFAASPSEIQVFETASILANPISKGSGADVESFPRHCIPLLSQPSHIGISCDHVHVAVALAPKDAQSCPVALIYSLTSLTTKNPTPAWELRLSSSPGVQVRDLVWNPGLPQLICFCLSNGSVSVYELKGTSLTFQIFSLPETTCALCVSWSPKGKQLVIGTANGSLVQYKPDLKQVKAIPAPPPSPGNESAGIVSPISILWLSSFQFAVVYGNLADSGGNSRPGLYIVNTPKGGNVAYINYDDICYSCGDQRPIQYFLTHQQRWNVLLMSSANSTEVGVLAADGSSGEPLTWEQWALEDASRAELPLSSTREEMYSIGMAIDTSPITPIPWGENQTIPPAPLLLILSHHGLLCAFNILNFRPGAPHDLCTPPELIPTIREVLVNSGPPSSSPSQPAATPQNAPTFGALPSIGSEEPGLSMTSKPSLSFAPSMQTPSSLFSASPANQSFSSLGAASSSVIGGQSQKPASDKGWLSEQPGSTFSGFGSIGSGAVQPKDGMSAAPAAASSFLYSQPSAAPAAFPGSTATTVSTFSSQSQPVPNFSFGGQSQALSLTPTQTVQPAAQPPQSFPTFGSSSPLISKAPSADKPGEAPLGLTITGKGKPGSVAEAPQSEVSSSNLGGERLGSQQWSSSSAGVAVPKQPPSTLKSEVQSAAPASSVVQNQAQVASNTTPVVSNAAIHRAIAKETELFQKELKLLKERHQKLNIEIGSTSEKTNLVQRIEGMSNFLCELNETTQGQALEISALKTLLVEAFAWVEEAKSRQMHSKSSRYIHLAVNQDLDPVLKKYQLTVRNRIHYLDTQLQQIDNNLDNQWLQFQNSYHRKYKSKILYGDGDGPDNFRKGIHMPSMEYVYQTILNLQQILEQQKARLDELEAKLKDRAKWELGSSLYDVSSSFSGRRRSPQKSLSYDQDLSSMAESLLAIQLHASNVEGKMSMLPCGKNPLIPKKISSRQRSQLCHLLAHRPMTRVLPSPRRISSALLPIPSSVNDSVSPVKLQGDKSDASYVSSPSGVQAKPTSTPTNKDQLLAKENIHLETSVMPATTPFQQAVVSSAHPTSLKINEPSFAPAVKVSTAPTFGISSNPSFGVSLASSLSSTSLQSAPALNFSGPSTQKTLLTNFAAPAMGSLNLTSSAPPKSSATPASSTPACSTPASTTPASTTPASTTPANTTPATATSTKGTLSAVSIPSTTAISSLSASTPSTTAAQSVGAGVTTTSTSVLSMSSSTKSVPFQSSNISMFGKNPTTTATSSSEGNSWSFSSNFNFGSTTKPGISITGNQAVSTNATPVSSSTPVTTTANSATSTPAFSLNFSAPTSQTGKPLFSLGTKPATAQSSFTLPSSFGSQSGSTTLKKEPLFVFGSSFGSTAGTASVGSSAAEKSHKQEEKDEKKSEEENKGKEEKSPPEVAPQVMERKQDTAEKPASTFSFSSAFGNSATSFGKSSPAVSTAVPVPTTSTPVSVAPAVTTISPVYEDITPEKKAEEVSANKGTPEEKPPPARSLFSEFNFKLSGAKSESSGEKPSIFGSSTSPGVTSAPVVPSIFGSPSPTTTSLQSTVTTTTPSTTLPVISQPEPSTATPNPLSSLGIIVANLGGNNFDKSTPETTKPSNAFTSFSFSLSSKDSATKPLTPDATAAVSGDGQKTPIKAFSTTTAEPTTSSTPVTGSLPAGNSDFGQGLANILGQSLPSSPAQPQQTQQPAANPFASTGGLFGSSTGSSPSTASLFGKPTEGSPSVGIFGQPLKQESSVPLFGSPSSTTPATTSGPTFESGSMFGQAASPSSSSSIFGGGGFGSKPFGQTTGTGFSLSGSIFGQSVGASSNTSSIFGSPSASTSAAASPFQTPATAASGVFGSSGGFGSVAQTGFGSRVATFQVKPGGFGGSPVFGAMAAPGSPPSFGGSPSFGSPPSFGGHVFGASSGGSVFGSALPVQGTTTASTFENLANAQTITFGNLAQSGNTDSMFGGSASSQTSPQISSFGGAASSGAASGMSSFGGSSFTSWR